MVLAVPEIQEEVVVEEITPLKPSEAIRLGAMSTYQMKGRLTGANQYGKFACAIGAAALAADVPNRKAYDWFNSQFSDHPPYECPVVTGDDQCYNYTGRWVDVVVHLNDIHRLPREWIADYLESLGH